MRLNWESDGILGHFRHLQKTSRYTDLTFHCQEGPVSAHQVVLARVSRLLAGFMPPPVLGLELMPLDLHISVPDIRQSHMEAVMELVYTGQVHLTRADYAHFRSICQLLDIAVPLADYDHFFSKSHLAQLTRRLPLTSPEPGTAQRQMFECHVCHQKFPLKIAWQRHRRFKHGLSLPPPLKPLRPVPGDPLLGSGPGKHSQYAWAGQMSVQCPTCRMNIRPSRAREHLANHLRIPLLRFVLDADQRGGPKQCSLCGYQAAQASYVARHAGMSHNKIHELANEAQMAFLREAKKSNRRVKPQMIRPDGNKMSMGQPRMMNTAMGNLMEED